MNKHQGWDPVPEINLPSGVKCLPLDVKRPLKDQRNPLCHLCGLGLFSTAHTSGAAHVGCFLWSLVPDTNRGWLNKEVNKYRSKERA